jgi:hypothetical protein
LTFVSHPEWEKCLDESDLSLRTAFLHRQTKKLLIFICGSEEKYRQLKDFHLLSTYLQEIRRLISSTSEKMKKNTRRQRPSISYLSKMIEKDQFEEFIRLSLSLVHLLDNGYQSILSTWKVMFLFIFINKWKRTIDPTESIRRHSIAKQRERFDSSTMNDKFTRLSIGEKNPNRKWFLAKTTHLRHPQRTDVNIDLAIPIEASNLMEEIRFFVIPLDSGDRVNLILASLGNKGTRSNRSKMMKIQ